MGTDLLKQEGFSRIRIATSRLKDKYACWLRKLQSDVEWIDLYDKEPGELARQLQSCSGLLLTGGGDIGPYHYGKADYGKYCRDLDPKRDELELKLTGMAMDKGLPVFAICRGMQMLNVAMGGTLIPDIPACLGGTVVHQDKEDVTHPVSVVFDSQLTRISGVSNEVVNSSHHQAIDRLASGFVVSAISRDGIAEAIEYTGRAKLFCVGVQWHPERMMMDNPLSGKLGRAFLKASKKVTSKE